MNDTNLPIEFEQTDLPEPIISRSPGVGGEVLLDKDRFEMMQRAAKLFASSKLVPAHFQGDVASTFVACHMAHNLRVDPMMLMQNCYVVHGRPALEGKLVIALANSRGPYPTGLKFSYSGEGDSRSCLCTGTRDNGEIDTADMSVATVKKAGWWAKNSQWAVYTDQMLAYRSATFLVRKHCPEVLMGMCTTDEARDISGPAVTVVPRRSAEQLNVMLEDENE